MNEQKIVKQIEEYIAEHSGTIVEDIAKIVSFNSVSGAEPPAEGAPYGAGPRAALDAALDMARGYGLETNSGDGYMGWAELAGQQKGYIATVTHLDVVPPGEGWEQDPFQLTQREGWLIGRGVIDNKGPSVLCIHAARFFKQLGIPLRYGLRVLLGCSEETDMSDVKYYINRSEQPLFCFSPDASFPLCNGEKGLFVGEYVSAPLRGKVVEFEAGQAFNVIPETASCVVQAPAAALRPTSEITLASAGEGRVRLTARGKGGHAAHPEGTVNAIGLLVAYLLENGLCSKEEAPFFELLQKLYSGFDGSGLGLACSDEMFGALTVNGGVISKQDGVFTQSIDIRYPTCTSGEELNARLAALAQAHGAGYEGVQYDEPYYISADSPAVKVLLQTYGEVTGKQAQPFTMGGGTYARHFKNAASFGPSRPDEPMADFVSMEHGPNEGARLDSLLCALKIYILSIWRLQQVDFE